MLAALQVLLGTISGGVNAFAASTVAGAEGLAGAAGTFLGAVQTFVTG